MQKMNEVIAPEWIEKLDSIMIELNKEKKAKPSLPFTYESANKD